MSSWPCNIEFQSTARHADEAMKLAFDFRLGLNAAQTTLGAVAQLAGATVRK